MSDIPSVVLNNGVNMPQLGLGVCLFITGTGRGMGVPIAKAALAAGNAVIATAITKETHQ
jgi:diketogulonate reductase-like aldo/keto reductase